MRIEKLSYHNHVTGWQLAPMEFGTVNLLVGVSGVGKTKILEAIISLKEIALGKQLNGVEWDITFSTSGDERYIWGGKFSILPESHYTVNQSGEKKYLKIENNEAKLERESLYLNNDLIASRNGLNIEFGGKAMPKLSPSESLIKIFMAEDAFMPIINGWLLVANSYAQHSNLWLGSSLHDQIWGLSLSDIKNPNSTLVDRLGLLFINYPEEFNKIKFALMEIFPQVEDLRILRQSVKSQGLEKPFIVFSLEIKEVGVDEWITQSNISMGMLKTLIHITEIYLTPEGSVMLIDEFENSLGVNCIDVVSDLLNKQKDVQFVITSHHPYLINKIPMQYWKIITRKGSLVTATNATDYEELSGSRHKVFTQLINLPAYTEGIQVG